MSTKPLSRKLADYTTTQKWKWLSRLGLNNARINRELVPADEFALADLRVPTHSLMLSSKDYYRIIETPALSAFRELKYIHNKPLEYLVSSTLLKLHESACIMDAAGGADAEFIHALRHMAPHKFTAYCQDSLLSGQVRDGITYIGGSIESVPLPDQTFDGITCHHSFEHFRGDLDIRFMREMIRLLKPNGTLIISPLFLCNEYAEIWNIKPLGHYDEHARVIYDSTASFAGWGPYEGFARTYSVAAFRHRILSVIPETFKVTLYQIFMDGCPVPDINKNSHQPLANAEMKALVVTKKL
jgi:SAM-dependent methyltransferase